MTLTLYEAFEYIDMARESEGEQRAEYGSGAVSLGYDGGEAMLHYDGYRASNDAGFRQACRIVDEYYEAKSLVRVTHWPQPVNNDDILF